MSTMYDKQAIEQLKEVTLYSKLGKYLSSDNVLYNHCPCKVRSKYLTINCNTLHEATKIAKQLPNATISLGHIDTTESDVIELLSPETGELITLTQYKLNYLPIFERYISNF